MPPPWSLADITELDLRLHEDALSTEDTDSAPLESPGTPRAEAIGRWLARCRKADPGPAHKARLAVRSEKWIRLAAFFLFMLAGGGTAQALLWYDGTRLINVGAFLGVLVFGQLALLLALAVSGLLLRGSLAGPYRALVFHFTGQAESIHSLPLWQTRAFASMQIAGAGFNLGALLTTAAKGLTADLAFGWATTLRVDPGQIQRLTTALARPWGGAFAPTPEQIEGSRILLVQGTRHVDGEAAAAWWPFLIMCLLVYGLLPRLLLALGGEISLRRKLRRVPLNDPRCERLYMRLTRPSLGFSLSGERETVGERAPSGKLPAPLKPKGPVCLLLPEAHEGPSEDAANAVAGQLGVPVEQWAASPENIETVPSGGVVWWQEVWQPPLEETLARIRSLRERIGADPDISILGSGLPAPAHGVNPPEPGDAEVWSAALSRLRDPHLQFVAWQS